MMEGWFQGMRSVWGTVTLTVDAASQGILPYKGPDCRDPRVFFKDGRKASCSAGWLVWVLGVRFLFLPRNTRSKPWYRNDLGFLSVNLSSSNYVGESGIFKFYFNLFFSRKKNPFKDFCFTQCFQQKGSSYCCSFLSKGRYWRYFLLCLSVKIHVSSCGRREITVFSHFLVPDRKEITCVLQKRSLFCVGGSMKYLGGLLSVTPAPLLSCIFIEGSFGRYRTQLKHEESTLFCPGVFLRDGTASAAFSLHLSWR